MDEEGVDTGEKAGMSRKLVAGIIVATIVMAGLGAVMLRSWNSELNDDNAGSAMWADIYLDTRDTDEAWIVTVERISGSHDAWFAERYLNESWIEYRLNYNKTDLSTYQSETRGLDEVRTALSPMGVMWVDTNNSKLIEEGDYFVINKSGGTSGRANAHDSFRIESRLGGFKVFPSLVHLPPAQFLEMDVAKTPTGWNMTVTWVNGTVPEAFLEGWRIGLRMENETGAYGTFFGSGTGKIGWSVPLDMIDSNYVAEPGTYDAHNMTYHLIDWFDNDADRRLSVNDTILIDKSSEIKDTLNFIFSSSQYGYRHVISEVTLP